LFDSLSRFGGKFSRGGVGQLSRMLPRGVAQEPDLPAITATPLAKQKVNAQPKPLERRQPALQRVGLQPDRVFAAWGNGRQTSEEGLQRALRLLHCLFSRPKRGNPYGFSALANQGGRSSASGLCLLAEPVCFQTSSQRHARAMQHHP